jgi:hypothetical protein
VACAKRPSVAVEPRGVSAVSATEPVEKLRTRIAKRLKKRPCESRGSIGSSTRHQSRTQLETRPWLARWEALDVVLIDQACRCECGESRFPVHGKPLTRFFCHCRICQSVYGKPAADVTVFWGGAVSSQALGRVSFRKYRRPPALRRGTCPSCGKPAVGFLALAPMVNLTFVPSANFPDPSQLPAPEAHIFYHRRVQDASDSLPKVSGYWPSEWMVTRLVMAGTFRR